MNPGAKPTMSGMNTGHASTADAIKKTVNLSYLNPSNIPKFNIDQNKVDRTEFESVTPRVQGGYTTRLYYRPTGRTVYVQILIVVFLARILFENKIDFLWYF